MKKILLGVLLLFVSSSGVFAQQSTGSEINPMYTVPDQGVDTRIMPVPPDQSNINFFGEDQFYTVTFRGNGEAIVTAKYVLTNTSQGTMNSVALRFPKSDPKDVLVYQVIRDRQCIRYNPVPLMEGAKIRTQNCAEYQEPDYFQYWGQSRYQKAPTSYSGDTLTITLPTPIKANFSGSYVLYYRALGYAKKDLFGGFNYTFETPKVEGKIRNLQVGITGDSDILFKGEKGKVNYRFDESVASLKAAPQVADGVRSAQFDNFYQQIGQGTVIKTASNLQPLESYTVKGKFAASNFGLYGKDIFVGILVTILFIVVLALIFRWFKGKYLRNASKSSAQSERNMSILGTLGISLVSSILIVGYTVLIWVLFQVLAFPLYNNDIFVILLTVLLSLVVYGIFLLGPALLMGLKKGVLWGLATFAVTILLLVFYMVVILVLYFIFQRQPQYYNMGVRGGVAPAMMESTKSVDSQN